MNREHVKRCIDVALRRGSLNHLDLETQVRKIGYITAPFDEALFWHIVREMVQEGSICMHDDEDEGFLYFYKN